MKRIVDAVRKPLGSSWLLALVCVLTGLGSCAPAPRLNVVIVTLDTTRADRLGPYGWARAGTPNYDQLAADGIVFEHCLSTAPVTLPSHSTIFTGRYPPAHGVRDNSIFSLPEEEITLAEMLRDAGYATGGFVGSVPVTRQFGIAQGFEDFDDDVFPNSLQFMAGDTQDDVPGFFFHERTATEVNAVALPWLERQNGPFFAWVHYWDAHQPLRAPSPFAERHLTDPYQAEISFVDYAFGQLRATLERAGTWDDTIVVLAADHGEGLGQHGEETHSLLAYQATLHVPLIVRIPGIEGGRRVSERVGNVDILPTVLDLLGLDAPEGTHGRSLAALVEGETRTSAPRPYYAETLSPRLSYDWGELRVLLSGNMKYIHGPRPELYDLDADPGELRDLSVERSDLAAEFEQRLGQMLPRIADLRGDPAHELDAATRQSLEAMGYLARPGSHEIQETLRQDGDAPQDHAIDNSLVSSVKSLIHREEWGQAVNVAERLVDLSPESSLHRGLLAQSLIGAGRTSEALRVVEHGPEAAPVDLAIVLDVARKVFSAGDEDLGIGLVRRDLEHRSTAPANYLLAEMLIRQGAEDESRELLVRATELDPDYAPALLSLGIREAQAERFEEAAVLLGQAVQQSPFNARYRYNRALALIGADRQLDAEEELHRAVALAPSYWPAQLTLLAIYKATGDADRAEIKIRDLRGSAPPRILERAEEIFEGWQ